MLLEFIKETQPEAYQTIVKRGEDKFLKRLADEIRKKGIIEILRKDVKDLDLSVFICYKMPASDLTQKFKNNTTPISFQLHASYITA